MKRQILSIATVLALTAAGASFAQSPQNTTAPGPTQQREPGQTNNNLPNPGNPQTDLQNNRGTYQEQGTVSGTAAESISGNQGANTTGSVTGTTQQEGSTTGSTTGTMNNDLQNEEGMDVDVDTGANARGAVDVDVNRTSDADTDASGIDETGGMDTQSGTYSGDTGSLPQTASELPTLALFGLLALFGAFVVRRVARA